jgi:hypothetical protein
MSSWPQMCVRCGEKDPEKLVVQEYKWQYMIFQTDTTSTWAYIHPKIAICKRCLRIARIRFWVSLVVSFVALIFGCAWSFGAFASSPDLLGLILLIPAIAMFMVLILIRRHVVRFYAHFYYSNGYVKGFFRNKEYQKEFKDTFPGGIYIKD